jgi:heterodisulfide reductase subunit C
MRWFESDRQKYVTRATAWVVPAPGRCVQCGVCSFNCPMAIDVRRYVWRATPVEDGRCLTCGECVKRCPRGVLRFLPMLDTTGARRATSLD